MPSLGSQYRARYFRDAYLKAVEVWALHAGIAPYTISIIYGPHLCFTGLPGWGWGGYGSHQRCLNNMCLMMSQAWEDSWGVGQAARWNAGETVEMYSGRGVELEARGDMREGDDIITVGGGAMKLHTVAAGLNGAVCQSLYGHHYLCHINESLQDRKKTSSCDHRSVKKHGHVSSDWLVWSLH